MRRTRCGTLVFFTPASSFLTHGPFHLGYYLRFLQKHFIFCCLALLAIFNIDMFFLYFFIRCCRLLSLFSHFISVFSVFLLLLGLGSLALAATISFSLYRDFCFTVFTGGSLFCLNRFIDDYLQLFYFCVKYVSFTIDLFMQVLI